MRYGFVEIEFIKISLKKGLKIRISRYRDNKGSGGSFYRF